MNIAQIQAGAKVTYTPTGKMFRLAKVTATRVSWYVDACKSSWGKNTMRMTWCSLKQFQQGIENGTYVIV